MSAPRPHPRRRHHHPLIVTLAVLTATTTLGGECQEYLDSVAEEERQQAAALDERTRQAIRRRLDDALPRRKLLHERLAAQITHLQEVEQSFLTGLPPARARLQALPENPSCLLGPKPEGEARALLMQAAPGAALVPRLAPEIAAAQSRLRAPLDALQRSIEPNATLAEYRRMEESLAGAEGQARDALERIPDWAWAVVIERRRPAQVSPGERGLTYASGLIAGIAYLYSVQAGEFVCLSRFTAENTPNLPLVDTRYESHRRYDPYSRRTQTEHTAVHEPLSPAAAQERLDRDLDRNLWPAIPRSAVRAKLAPLSPAPPPRRRTR